MTYGIILVWRPHRNATWDATCSANHPVTVSQAACRGELAGVQLAWSDSMALTVVMAAKGYPGSYAKGGAIGGLDSISTAKVMGRRTPAASF